MLLSWELRNPMEKRHPSISFEVEDAEYLLPVWRDGVLVVNHPDVAESERFNQGAYDLVMRDRTVGFGRRWCGHQCSFFAANRSAAIANERTSF